MTQQKRTEILIVDESPLFRDMLSIGLCSEIDLKVKSFIGNATNLTELTKQFAPEYIFFGTDKVDSKTNELITNFAGKNKTKLIVISNDKTHGEVSGIEYVSRPALGQVEAFDMLINMLKSIIQKVPFSADVSEGVFTKAKKKQELDKAKSINVPHINVELSPYVLNNTLIAIGSSTGGTEAVWNILRELPALCPPILIVQHMPPVFTTIYAERLNRDCRLEVVEAYDGCIVRPGLVILGQGDLQMELVKKGDKLSVKCVDKEKFGGHCPSVDVLFNSVASIVKNNAVGIILTGMGKDGAQGLLNMKNNGAYTIGQDEESCIVYGMPREAYMIGAVTAQLPLDKIAQHLMKTLKSMGK